MGNVRSFLDNAQRVDPHSRFDQSESSRVPAFISLCCAQISLLILGVLSFSQFLGGHRGQTVPMNTPMHKGGWDTGNDYARGVVSLFGTIMLMVCIVLVNDPSRHPQRFKKSYKEAIIYLGYSLRFVALGCVGCAFVDIDLLTSYDTCVGCSKAEYIATCLFDFFSFITLIVASVMMITFGEKTPEEPSDEDIHVKEFLLPGSNLSLNSAELNSKIIVAVTCPTCDSLIPIESINSHLPACESRHNIMNEMNRKSRLEKRNQLKVNDQVEEDYVMVGMSLLYFLLVFNKKLLKQRNFL